MTIASYLTRGIGPDGTPAGIILRGFTTSPTAGLLVTRGFGTGATIAGTILRGFTPVSSTQSATICTTTSWTGYSLQENQTPTTQVGDTFYADYVTTPGGYNVNVAGDGTVTIDTHGDTTRQQFQADIFSVSLGANIGAFTVYINNHAPQLNVQPADVRVLVNNAMTGINFTPTDPLAVAYVIDQDNDPITGQQISGSLPVGVTFAGNILAGTPTAAISNDVSFRFSDPVGEYCNVTINYLADIGTTVPNVVGLTSVEAANALTAATLLVGSGSSSTYSATVPVGNIISQGTAAGSRTFTGSEVNLVTSLGSLNVAVPNVIGLTVAAASTALTTAGFVIGTITDSYTDASAAGTIIAQSASGTAAYGTTINLTRALPTFLLESYFSGAGIYLPTNGFPR